jgi:hypothetical protein
MMHTGSLPQDSSSIVHINALYSLLSHAICPTMLTLLSIPSFPSFLGCVLQMLLVWVYLVELCIVDISEVFMLAQ